MAAQAPTPVPLTHLHLLPTSSVPRPWQAALELGQTTTFGGARAEGGGGTGNQTYHGWIAVGLPGRLAVLGFLQGNDDPTWTRLDGTRYRQETFSVGGGLRATIRQGGTLELAVQGTLERLDLKSDPGLFTPRPGLRRTHHTAGTASVMAGVTLARDWRLTVSPGVLILPGEVNGLPYYGWTGVLGAGLDGALGASWRGFASAEIPAGPGANSLEGLGHFRRVPVASAGLAWDAGARTRLTLFVTNSAGGTPATRHLTQVGRVPVQWGARVRVSPTARESRGPRAPHPDRVGPSGDHRTLSAERRGVPRPGIAGMAVAGTGTIAAWRAGVRVAADRRGGHSARLRLGLSTISELEVGVVRSPGLDGDAELGIRLGGDPHYRLGGKLILRDAGQDGGPGIAARVSLGRDAGTRQGYLVAEVPVSVRLSGRVSAVVAPLFLQTGGESPLALGAALVGTGPGGVALVLEPTFRLGGGPLPWTVAVRSPGWAGIRAELFATTAEGILGAGRFLHAGDGPRWGVALSVEPR